MRAGVRVVLSYCNTTISIKLSYLICSTTRLDKMSMKSHLIYGDGYMTTTSDSSLLHWVSYYRSPMTNVLPISHPKL